MRVNRRYINSTRGTSSISSLLSSNNLCLGGRSAQTRWGQWSLWSQKFSPANHSLSVSFSRVVETNLDLPSSIYCLRLLSMEPAVRQRLITKREADRGSDVSCWASSSRKNGPCASAHLQPPRLSLPALGYLSPASGFPASLAGYIPGWAFWGYSLRIGRTLGKRSVLMRVMSGQQFSGE